MPGRMFTHRVGNLKASLVGLEHLGWHDKAEKVREVLRMIDRGHLKTLAEIDRAQAQRGITKL